MSDIFVFQYNAASSFAYMLTSNLWFFLLVVGVAGTIFLLLKEEVSHFPPLYRSFFSYLHFLSHIKFNYYNVPYSRNANIFSIASCLVMPSLLAFIAIYSCATPYALQQATKLLYTSPWKWNSFSIRA